MYRLYRKMTINGHFPYNLYIFVRLQHFLGPILRGLYQKPSCNEPSFKEVLFYIVMLFDILQKYFSYVVQIFSIMTIF